MQPIGSEIEAVSINIYQLIYIAGYISPIHIHRSPARAPSIINAINHCMRGTPNLQPVNMNFLALVLSDRNGHSHRFDVAVQDRDHFIIQGRWIGGKRDPNHELFYSTVFYDYIGSTARSGWVRIDAYACVRSITGICNRRIDPVCKFQCGNIMVSDRMRKSILAQDGNVFYLNAPAK